MLRERQRAQVQTREAGQRDGPQRGCVSTPCLSSLRDPANARPDAEADDHEGSPGEEPSTDLTHGSLRREDPTAHRQQDHHNDRQGERPPVEGTGAPDRARDATATATSPAPTATIASMSRPQPSADHEHGRTAVTARLDERPACTAKSGRAQGQGPATNPASMQARPAT